MTYITEKQAAELECPIARTFDQGKSARCDGSKCILWRWKEIPSNDHRFMSAVKREAVSMLTDYNAGNPEKKRTESYFVKAATAKVSADLWGNIIPNETDRGYCGLGDKP